MAEEKQSLFQNCLQSLRNAFKVLSMARDERELPLEVHWSVAIFTEICTKLGLTNLSREEEEELLNLLRGFHQKTEKPYSRVLNSLDTVITDSITKIEADRKESE